MIATLKTFVCPTTKNNVNPNSINKRVYNGVSVTVLNDLTDKATDKNANNGHSYEVFGFWHTYGAGNFPRKTLQSIQRHRNTSTANMKIRNTFSGPPDIFTIMDRLQPHAPYHENVPNPSDGHGLEGANAVFTDGHGEFINAKNGMMIPHV